MNKYEVRLEVKTNSGTNYVHTFVYADSPIQARSLAEAMVGTCGRIIFGPYPID